MVASEAARLRMTRRLTAARDLAAAGPLVAAVRILARTLGTLIAVSAITFILLKAAPGDFADISRIQSGAAGLSAGQAATASAELQARYGAAIPDWKQYLIFMRGVFTADLGPSYQYPQLPVQQILVQALPVSAGLAFSATVLSVLIALPVGVFAARRHNTMLDHGPMFVATLGQTVPNYVAGVALVLLFSQTLHWLPVSGWTGPTSAILPVLALSLGPIAVLARYVRSSVLETINEEYVLVARAKGASESTVIWRHVLRNSLIPLVTVVGPMLAALMVGTVFVEYLFRIPGLGQYFVNSARSRDMPLLMGTTLLFAAIVIVTNQLVDIAYGLLDPRIREARRAAR